MTPEAIPTRSPLILAGRDPLPSPARERLLVLSPSDRAQARRGGPLAAAAAFLLAAMAMPSGARGESFESALAGARAEVLGSLSRSKADVDSLIAVATDRSRGESERMAAIRELRTAATHERRASGALIALMNDGSDSLPVRRRSAQSLGLGVALVNSEYRRVFPALLAVARESQGRVPLGLREMAVKALYWSPVNERSRPDMTAELLAWTSGREPEAVRVAALWSVASVATRDDVRAELIRILEDGRESPAVREQALKSLYPAADWRESWRAALGAALDRSEPESLRVAATLFLSGARRHSEVQRALEQDLPQDPSPNVRAAAAQANDPDSLRALWRYFRLRYDPILHRMIEVLELE